jgi:hypothetical protein
MTNITDVLHRLRIRQREAEAAGLWPLAQDLGRALHLIEQLERERTLFALAPRSAEAK